MTQLELDGAPTLAPPEVTLTDRQRLALAYVAGGQPVPSDELGAVLHEDRAVRGGRGHARDERCDWCGSEGAQMGESLRAKGIVVRKRGLGWCLPGYLSTNTRRSNGYDPETADIPF